MQLIAPQPGVDIWHVGTLVAEHRGRQGASLEGPCLSVSVDPLAWRRIARLGGAQLFRMDAERPVFCDVHALLREAEGEVRAWAVRMGFVREGVAYRAWWHDEELDAWVYSTHKCRAEAESELEADDAVGPDGGPAVQEVACAHGTDRLAAWCAVPITQLTDAQQWMVLPWIDAYCPEALGPWWSEAYEPACLSAPRGGILPSRLHAVRWSPAEWHDAVDASEDGERLLPWPSRHATAFPQP